METWIASRPENKANPINTLYNPLYPQYDPNIKGKGAGRKFGELGGESALEQIVGKLRTDGGLRVWVVECCGFSLGLAPTQQEIHNSYLFKLLVYMLWP